LLRQIGVPFWVQAVDLDESVQPGEAPLAVVKRLALAKAHTAQNEIRENASEVAPVLAADTIVVAGQKILGKPRSRSEAISMLTRLSGCSHQVVTGIALLTDHGAQAEAVVSTVTFATLASHQIEAYCDTGEPFGKAGAYAIQGIGASFVQHISGSYSGIVGLPLYETCRLLRRSGLIWSVWSQEGQDE
jgi:septum formation protein